MDAGGHFRPGSALLLDATRRMKGRCDDEGIEGHMPKYTVAFLNIPRYFPVVFLGAIYPVIFT